MEMSSGPSPAQINEIKEVASSLVMAINNSATVENRVNDLADRAVSFSAESAEFLKRFLGDQWASIPLKPESFQSLVREASLLSRTYAAAVALPQINKELALEIQKTVLSGQETANASIYLGLISDIHKMFIGKLEQVMAHATGG
jgi:hypothetical protein